MTLKNTINYFENLISKTNNKSEIKIYREFIQIIKSLEKRNLSESEIQSIEEEIENLDLQSDTENRKKYFKKTLSKFKKYLKETFSLVSEGYYSNMGTALGLSFGVLFGVVFLSGFERSLGISVGIAIGMIIGLIIGQYMDSQAKKANKVL